jgi:hypothetical protein
VCQTQRQIELAKRHVIDDDRVIFGPRISPLDGSSYLPMRFPYPSDFDRVEKEHVNAEERHRIVNISTDFERGLLRVHYDTGHTFELL